MNWIESKPIAHRGLHSGSEVPENSLLAFEKAIEGGHPIELDVHLMSDGGVVVFHDEDLVRLCGVDKAIADCNSRELQEHKLFGSSYSIPLLKEVLELVAGRVPIAIELKAFNFNPQLAPSTWQVLKDYQGEFAVQSFNPKCLSWFKQNAPHIKTGLIAGSMVGEPLPLFKRLAIRNLLVFPFLRPDYIAYEGAALNYQAISLVRRFSKIPIIAWTIRDQLQLKNVEGLCQNIIFENIY
ncbi:MAG: glycerophosphodiester phosphodiesterase [Halobacteriovoraceae bacterium]|nr:glycerophosphodiester phosphodiesterase [Halobacteriovoraceae bacterium]